jgi:hypothetical protein
MSFLVRRARSSWLLLGCVTVTILLTTGLAAAGWTFAGAVIPSGARGILAAPQSRVVGLSGVGSAREAAGYSRDILSTLRKAWPGVGFRLESALWAEPIQLPQPASSTTEDTTQIQVASLQGFTGQATLTAGQWPGTPERGAPLPVALPVIAASRLHLTLGSVLTGTPPSGGPSVSVRVTGLYRPDNPASPYWAIDLLPVSGVTVQIIPNSFAGRSAPTTQTVYGPAVVSPAAFGDGLAASQSSWFVLPQAAALAGGNISALAASTSQAASQLGTALPQGLTVTSSLPQLLTGMASTIVLTRSLFTIAALLLLLVAGAGLVLAARLLAGQREEESALLRARGATSWQLARPVLAEALLLGAVACLTGVLVGTRLTGALASLGDLSLGGYQERGIPVVAWLSALAVLVLCAVMMTWPALRSLTPGAARLRRGRQARLAGIAWAGGDLALVALAAVAVWQLHGYSAVSHPATGSLGIDPVVAIAPALAVAGVAIIPLRGLPLLARLADRATDYERRLAAAMVSWQIARRPIRQAGPALLVVIATATTTLGVAGYASWRQSVADQAAFAVGSDVRVDSGGELPPGTADAITGAPGVTAATSASSITIRLAGRIGAVPGVVDSSVLVLPLSALGSGSPGTNLVLVSGPGLNEARLSAAVRAAPPGTSLMFRAAALAALTAAPVTQAAQTALVQGMAAAAGFGVLVLLLSLLLTAGTRETTLAALATMGLRRWQAQLLLATETLPPVATAAIGGIACATLLAPLVGPSLNLAAFSGTGSAVVVTPVGFPLAASALGLLLAALLVLAVQAVITYRGSARALRIAD